MSQDSLQRNLVPTIYLYVTLHYWSWLVYTPCIERLPVVVAESIWVLSILVISSVSNNTIRTSEVHLKESVVILLFFQRYFSSSCLLSDPQKMTRKYSALNCFCYDSTSDSLSEFGLFSSFCFSFLLRLIVLRPYRIYKLLQLILRKILS